MEPTTNISGNAFSSCSFQESPRLTEIGQKKSGKLLWEGICILDATTYQLPWVCEIPKLKYCSDSDWYVRGIVKEMQSTWEKKVKRWVFKLTSIQNVFLNLQTTGLLQCASILRVCGPVKWNIVTIKNLKMESYILLEWALCLKGGEEYMEKNKRTEEHSHKIEFSREVIGSLNFSVENSHLG